MFLLAGGGESLRSSIDVQRSLFQDRGEPLADRQLIAAVSILLMSNVYNYMRRSFSTIGQAVSFPM